MADIVENHKKEYEDIDKISVASAPGRICLIGENGLIGRRLMIGQALDRRFTIAVSRRHDGQFRFFQSDSGERKRFTILNLRFRREDRWVNYIKAAIAIFVEAPAEDAVGQPDENTLGLCFTVSSTIPRNKGFGSSSALELAAAIALRPLFNPDMSDDELIARLAVRHKEYFDDEDDIADFYLTMKAEENMWTIINEEKIKEGLSSLRNIAVPFANYKTLIFDSRVPPFESSAEVEKRNMQLRKGLDILAQRRRNTTFQTPEALEILENERDIPEQMRRRCIHATAEASRIRDIETAFAESDMQSVSKLFQQSQVSLRDLFEVSCPEVDWLVRRAAEMPGCAASRTIGQGFGGSTFAIMTHETEKAFREKLEDYERIFGFHPQKIEVKSGFKADNQLFG